jgi:hypothetical protein
MIVVELEQEGAKKITQRELRNFREAVNDRKQLYVH